MEFVQFVVDRPACSFVVDRPAVLEYGLFWTVISSLPSTVKTRSDGNGVYKMELSVVTKLHAQPL